MENALSQFAKHGLLKKIYCVV